jgi:NitT/TauT family transport system ATP-binding protein
MLKPYQTNQTQGHLSKPMLSIDRMNLVYSSSRGPVTAIRDLSFSIRKGEFVSILGPSGCGKSTLLRIVSGLLRPTSGKVVVADVEVKAPRPDIGIVFQQPTLLPWKTVLENVLVPIRAMRMPVADYKHRAHDLLRLVGLGDFINHYPYELSGGMQQRVGIARGLIHDPAMLLMDEPFAALDAMSREFMMDELQQIWMTTGKSVLFITHSIPEAVYLSDRVLTLSPRPGRVVDDLKIELPRARDVATMGQPMFGEYATHLRALFQSNANVRSAGAA